MTEIEVRAAADRHMPGLVEVLGLQDWRIEVRCERLGGGGNCTIHSGYQYAIVRLDPEQIDDEAELVTILRHELTHVLLWPIHAFADMVQQALPGGELPGMGFTAWQFYVERAVNAVELLMDRHDIGAPSLGGED